MVDREAFALGLRVAIAVPVALAVSDLLIGGAQGPLFTAFGSFALLAMANFGGPPLRRLRAYVACTVISGALIAIATPFSGDPIAAGLLALPILFGIRFGGSFGSQFSAGVTATTLAFVLAIAVEVPSSALDDRLLGWAIAGAFATAAALLLWPTWERAKMLTRPRQGRGRVRRGRSRRARGARPEDARGLPPEPPDRDPGARRNAARGALLPAHDQPVHAARRACAAAAFRIRGGPQAAGRDRSRARRMRVGPRRRCRRRPGSGGDRARPDRAPGRAAGARAGTARRRYGPRGGAPLSRPELPAADRLAGRARGLHERADPDRA